MNKKSDSPSDAELSKNDFGDDFIWGTATASFQVEGSLSAGGRGASIWDTFTAKPGKIKNADKADLSCDFYNLYESDLDLVSAMGFTEFRFSISWSRIFPLGTGRESQAGIDFYNRLIQACLERNITPWITLYHWDLPQELENRGGWMNRDIVEWFEAYVTICTREFGDRVKNWIILNEPMAVAGLGYTTGLHAPGKKGIWNFLPVVHHLALCQAAGGRIVRKNVENAYIGTALSCSKVEPATTKPKDIRAAQRADALMNRLFIEPLLGMGYPADAFSYLSQIKKYMLPGDEERLKFDFDFLGLQNYFSVVVRHSYMSPVLWLKEVSPANRGVSTTANGWEISPNGMYDILHQFSKYAGIREIVISENGAYFHDECENDAVADKERIHFFQQYLGKILQAKQEGVNVKGYFAWSLMDNFEWTEGYAARFGLVYVDFSTQKRVIKNSGKWFTRLLRGN